MVLLAEIDQDEALAPVVALRNTALAFRATYENLRRLHRFCVGVGCLVTLVLGTLAWSPAVHFVLYLLEVSANPAVTATAGIGASALPLVLWAVASRFVNGPRLVIRVSSAYRSGRSDRGSPCRSA